MDSALVKEENSEATWSLGWNWLKRDLGKQRTANKQSFRGWMRTPVLFLRNGKSFSFCIGASLRSWLLAGIIWLIYFKLDPEQGASTNIQSQESDPPCQKPWYYFLGSQSPGSQMGRRYVTLTLCSKWGLPWPCLPHCWCPPPGRSKPAAELHANTSCSRLSATKGTEVNGEPCPQVHWAHAWPASQQQGLQVGPVGGSPSVINTTTLAAPGDPRVPGGGRRPCWRPRGNLKQPGPSLLMMEARL